MTQTPVFQDQVVLITGAGRGLGLAYARLIGTLGATILLHDVGADDSGNGLDPDIARAAAQRLRNEGIEAHPFDAPIETREQCHALVTACLGVRGRLDALIHNAGWVAYERIEAIQASSFEHAMAVMAGAPLWLAQAAWPSLRAAGHGRIVLTTSDRALFPQYVHRGLATYAAAKMAAVGIVNVLAAEGADHGIVVNAVSPIAKTRMWRVEEEPQELKPAAVAPGVAFLASSRCHSGGWILRAANGQFHATRAAEASGVDYPRDLRGVPASTLDEVAEAWARIACVAREAR